MAVPSYLLLAPFPEGSGFQRSSPPVTKHNARPSLPLKTPGRCQAEVCVCGCGCVCVCVWVCVGGVRRGRKKEKRKEKKKKKKKEKRKRE